MSRLFFWFAAPVATGIIALALEAKYVFCFSKFVILVLIYILELLNLLLCWNSTHHHFYLHSMLLTFVFPHPSADYLYNIFKLLLNFIFVVIIH
jgi:hypothetical protein